MGGSDKYGGDSTIHGGDSVEHGGESEAPRGLYFGPKEPDKDRPKNQ